MKLKRLRQIWIRSLGFWLLREVSIDTAKNQVFEVKDDLRNQDDIDQYMASIMSRHLNIYKPLWEVHVKEDYIENKSVVFVIANHLITDGMGLMSLITFLNDAHNSENIVNHRSISFFYRYIYPIFWIPIGVFEYIIKGLKWKRDINMFPLILKGEIQSNNKVFMQSKQYDFSILKRCYTKFEQMKLNDFLVANITASMANYFNELGIKKLTYFTTSTPINMKSQPRTLDEVKLSNDWAPCLMNIPLSNDINFVMNQNQICYKNQFKIGNITFGALVITGLGLLPAAITKLLMSDSAKSINTIISNTPGPLAPIYFCDQVVYDLCAIGPNVGNSGVTFHISSYCGKVKIQFLADKELQMEPYRLLYYIEHQLNDSIQKYSKD